METERQRETETEREREKQRVSNLMLYAQSTITLISGQETETVTERQRQRDTWKERIRQTETGWGLSSDCGSEAKHWVFHGTLSFTKLTFASPGTCRQGQKRSCAGAACSSPTSPLLMPQAPEDMGHCKVKATLNVNILNDRVWDR